MQEPQLGTGHALLQARARPRRPEGTVLLLSGDVPLLTKASLERLHRDCAASAGRGGGGDGRPGGPGGLRPDRPRHRRRPLVRIVEDRDATPAERAIDRDQQRRLRLRAGLAVRGARAASAPAMPRASTTCRTWWTSTAGDGRIVDAPSGSTTPDEIRGINTRAELAEVGRLLQATDQRRADGRRRHAGGPGYRLHRAGRHDRRRHGRPPFVFLEGKTLIGRQLRDSRRRADHGLDASATTSRSTTTR